MNYYYIAYSKEVVHPTSYYPRTVNSFTTFKAPDDMPFNIAEIHKQLCVKRQFENVRNIVILAYCPITEDEYEYFTKLSEQN